MTTNGYLLEKHASNFIKLASKDQCRALDSLDNEIFQKMSGKKFNVNKVLDGIKKAQIEGFKDIKINTVVRKRG